MEQEKKKSITKRKKGEIREDKVKWKIGKKMEQGWKIGMEVKRK